MYTASVRNALIKVANWLVREDCSLVKGALHVCTIKDDRLSWAA